MKYKNAYNQTAQKHEGAHLSFWILNLRCIFSHFKEMHRWNAYSKQVREMRLARDHDQDFAKIKVEQGDLIEFWKRENLVCSMD